MYLLKIPYKSKPWSKLLVYWIANYIIDDNWIVLQERAELKNWTQFRWKWWKYWKKFNKEVIRIREQIWWNYDKDIFLWKEQIEKFNIYFKNNLTTFLNHDKYITWSNPTWSDYDLRKTPYLIDWWKYNQLMFVNFFKKLRLRNYKKIDIWLRNSNLKIIYLDEYFILFPNIKGSFLEKNKPLQLALTSENEDINLNMDVSKESEELIKLILDESYLKEKMISEQERDNKRINVLRRIFKNRMRKLEETDHIFWRLNESMCEAAHIYPVNKIRKRPIEDWYMIADNNNWLNLPIQIHKMYDKYFIYFDSNGNIRYLNPSYKEQLKILFNINNNLNIKSKNFSKKLKYIKMYNKFFLKK